MSFVSLHKSILNKTATGFTPNAIIDTLFDYKAFLKRADANNAITVQAPPPGKKVMVIGGGASGLVAAYELGRIPGVEVTLWEASPTRLGGRMDSIEVPDPPYQTKIFEMGCMRFPPTSYTLFHYLNKFGLKTAGIFPDPGKVATKLLYENLVIDWPAGQPAPDNADFKRIGKDFGEIVISLLGDASSPNITEPNKLFDYWTIYQDSPSEETKKGVVAAWQAIVDKYKDTSYYEAVYDLAQDTKVVAQAWSQEDMNKFGALGVGSGGFGPLYQVNFVDILRLFANSWEESQEFLQVGIKALVEKFIENFSPSVLYRLGEPVTKIKKMENGQYEVTCARKGRSDIADSVIVCTTTRAMEFMGLTVDGVTNKNGEITGSVLGQDSKVAIRKLHLMNSSKLFVTTTSKFWYKENNQLGRDLPQNMQTDELMRGLYCLDYDTTDSKKRITGGKGVVLISYNWGDDSTKIIALTAQERYDQFLEGVTKIDPEFAELLKDQTEEMQVIDWENTPNYYGAFKLNYPGQEKPNHDGFFQFQTENQGVFIAGDSISWAGGWLEGALPTGVNAACAAARYLGATVLPESPLDIPSDMYVYDKPPVAGK